MTSNRTIVLLHNSLFTCYRRYTPKLDSNYSHLYFHQQKPTDRTQSSVSMGGFNESAQTCSDCAPGTYMSSAAAFSRGFLTRVSQGLGVRVGGWFQSCWQVCDTGIQS